MWRAGSTVAMPAIAATPSQGGISAISADPTLVTAAITLNSMTSGTPVNLTTAQLPLNPNLKAPDVPISSSASGLTPNQKQLTNGVGEVIKN